MFIIGAGRDYYLITSPGERVRALRVLTRVGFLQTCPGSGFVLVGAGEVGMWSGARSLGETTSLAVALRPSIDRDAGDHKGPHPSHHHPRPYGDKGPSPQ